MQEGSGILESFEGSGLLPWPLEMAPQGKVHSEAHLQGGAGTLRLWVGGREREKR